AADPGDVRDARDRLAVHHAIRCPCVQPYRRGGAGGGRGAALPAAGSPRDRVRAVASLARAVVGYRVQEAAAARDAWGAAGRRSCTAVAPYRCNGRILAPLDDGGVPRPAGADDGVAAAAG